MSRQAAALSDVSMGIQRGGCRQGHSRMSPSGSDVRKVIIGCSLRIGCETRTFMKRQPSKPAFRRLNAFSKRIRTFSISLCIHIRKFPRPEQDAGACARRERNRLGLSRAEKLVPRCARSQTSACSRAALCTTPDTSSGTSIWSSRSLRPNLASPRAAAPTMPPAQLWGASVLRPLAQALMLPHGLPVVHRTVEEAEAGLSTRAAATPSQAAIAPTAPEPSTDTAQFRARVTHVRQSRLLTAARGHAHARILISILIGMVWYGAPPTPRQCVLSLRVVASCSVDPSGHSGQ
jgi:hypothetical protein